MPTHFPIHLDASHLPDQLALPAWSREPGQAPVDLSIRPPGSKSLTNRAFFLASLCSGTSEITHPLIDADDAARMLKAIEQLGARVDRSSLPTIKIVGVGGRWQTKSAQTIDLNNAGTATRFLAAGALLSDHPITITGNERMQQRPINELVTLLEELGASIEFLGSPGCPPLQITPPSPDAQAANQITIGPTQSSQFITALLLAAVFLPGGLSISLPQATTSASYVRMTIDLLEHLGVHVQHSENLSVIKVHPGLEAFRLEIEPDASGATYWWAAGALLSRATVRVEGLSLETPSAQGDAQFPFLLEQMGCRLIHTPTSLACKGPADLSPIMCDMRDMPDAVMSLASLACFATGTSIIRGVKTLRVKECDRIQAMKTELAKIGVVVEDNLNGDPDTLSITPPSAGVVCTPDAQPVCFDTYDDHRMAMSLSLIALRRPHITINNPACVDKTYPTFFTEFARLYR